LSYHLGCLFFRSAQAGGKDSPVEPSAHIAKQFK
jgi:hypothetical protein